MSRHSPPSLFRQLLALGLLVAVFLSVAMAGSPALHHWLHHDSDDSSHHCLATALSDGQLDSASAPAVSVVPVLAALSPVLPEPAHSPAPSLSAAYLLEHAPPLA